MARVYKTQANARLLDLVPDNAKTALDIGCATGSFGQFLQEKNIVADGITLSHEEKQAAEKYYREIAIHNLENGLPDTNKRYDVVVMSHVLEHVANPARLMQDLKTVVSEGGVILCAIPNMLFFYNRINLLLGNIEYKEYGIMDYTHVRWYTMKTVVELFESYQFKKEVFRANGNVPMRPLRNLLSEKTSASIDSYLVSAFPGLLAWEYSYSFRKA